MVRAVSEPESGRRPAAASGRAAPARARDGSAADRPASHRRAARRRPHQRQPQGDDPRTRGRRSPVAAPTATLLAIDRDAEYRNSRRAAESGAAPGGPRLPAGPQGAGGGVGRGPDARARRRARRGDLAARGRRVPACCTPARGSSTTSTCSPIQRRYLDIVRERGFRLPPRYVDLMPQVDGSPPRSRSGATRPCRATTTCWPPTSSTTATGSGSSTTSTRGNNDPCFELGNIWSESTCSLDQLEQLVDSYYGRPLRNKVARARLLGLMSKYGWTLWASIQDARQPDRLRLLVLGHGEVRAGRRGARRPGVRLAARGGPPPRLTPSGSLAREAPVRLPRRRRRFSAAARHSAAMSAAAAPTGSGAARHRSGDTNSPVPPSSATWWPRRRNRRA